MTDQRSIKVLLIEDNPGDVRLTMEALKEAKVVNHLTVLKDGGYSDEDAFDWLFREDETLPGTPVQALRDDRHTEVTRRAQALAL